MSEAESGPDLLDELAHEFAERFRRGERPALTEYTERYPELAGPIRALFPALVVMEEFGSVACEAPHSKAASGAVPRQLGEYRILREIGRGGMGVVYEAVQESLGRHVALKVLPLHHLMGATHLERFEREAKAAARLHHTNIVPVFGIGVHEGVHFYAMQFIQGQAVDLVLEEVRRQRAGTVPPAVSQPSATAQPLTVSIAQSLLADAPVEPSGGSPSATMTAKAATGSTAANGASELTGPSDTQYFRGVARLGVQVAEALAYAHRQNIVHRDIKPSNLLLDTQGIAWITDFGLVKDESASNLTNPGDIVGTIRYMAPERFKDQGDARSDIYSLGATLYEMLTLKPAFPGEGRADLIDRVRHEEPPRPRQLDARIPRDLETVVLKAMAKEPGRRYQGAGELAEDLRRYLADRPVLARRTTTVEQVWRWCRRNPTVATLGAFIVVLLTTLLAGAWFSNARLADRLEQVANAEREKTDKLWDSYLAHAQASRWSGRVGRRFEGLEAIRKAAAIRSDLRLRNEAIALWALPDMRIATEIPNGMPPGTHAVAYDSALAQYARSDNRGNLRIAWVADDRTIANLPGFGTHAYFLRFSPDSGFLAALYHTVTDLHVWDVAQRKVALKTRVLGAMDFSPDSHLAAVHQGDGKVHLHDLQSGGRERILGSVPVTHCYFAFGPGGKQLAVMTNSATHIYDVGGAKLVRTLPQPAGDGFWHEDGSLLALMNWGQIALWNTRTWTVQRVLNATESSTIKLANTPSMPSSDMLASAGRDDVLRLWDPATPQLLLSRHGCAGSQFSSDGRLLAATREGPKLQIWEVTRPREYRLVHLPGAPQREAWDCAFSPDGRLLARTSDDGVELWDVSAGRNVATLPAGPIGGVLFSANGNSIITRSRRGLMRWPIQPAAAGSLVIGPPELLLSLTDDCDHAALCPMAGGKVALNRRSLGDIAIVDPLRPGPPLLVAGHPNTTDRLHASPDGRWLAAMTHGELPLEKLRVSDVRTGQPAWTYPFKTFGTFSPDNKWLVTGGDECRIWEVGSWRLDRTVPRPAGLGNCSGAAYSPDGSVLALAYVVGTVRLVHPKTGQELATLAAPTRGDATKPCFSADGSKLAALTARGVHLWDLRLIRDQLAAMNLDWDLPPYPRGSNPEPQEPVRIHVVNVPPKPPTPPAHAPTPSALLSRRLALYEFLTASAPYHPEPLHQRGHLHEAMGRNREAVADFEAALAWQPAAAHLYCDRGRNYEALKDHARAIRDFDKAVALAPNYAPALNALAWLYVAGPIELRAPAKAVPLARRAVQLASGNWSYRNTLGVALYRSSAFREAVEVLETNSKDAKNVMVGYDWLFLALCQHRLGDQKNGRACYDRALAWQQQARLTMAQMEEWSMLRAEADAQFATNRKP